MLGKSRYDRRFWKDPSWARILRCSRLNRTLHTFTLNRYWALKILHCWSLWHMHRCLNSYGSFGCAFRDDRQYAKKAQFRCDKAVKSFRHVLRWGSHWFCTTISEFKKILKFNLNIHGVKKSLIQSMKLEDQNYYESVFEFEKVATQAVYTGTRLYDD